MKPVANTYDDIDLNIGSKHAFQHCGNVKFKRSFPNIDYALYGYHILKGFPLADGHDPGFTYPIFAADFSSNGVSADCRFFVPDGLVVNPDVSCFLSVTSQTVQTQYEYSKLLEAHTNIEGEDRKQGDNDAKAPKNTEDTSENPWGESFSASIGYKQTSSKLSSGATVYVFSTVKCKYYFSKLVQEEAPQFDEAFLNLLNKLDEADLDIQLYFKLFDTYGTHFVKEVTFGARYTFEHKMSSKYYNQLKRRNVNVNILSDYVGAKRLSLDASLSTTLQRYAPEFEENVETKVIPVGIAPAENGTALSWALEVQSNPIPTEYKLSSIEDLFTDTFMENMTINYQKMRGHIIGLKYQYCSFLQEAGKVESCANLGAGIILQNTKLLRHYKELAVTSISGCIDKCLKDVLCKATTYCISCLSKDPGYKKCFLLRGLNNSAISAVKTEKPDPLWQSNIFTVKMDTQLKLSDVSVIGPEISIDDEDDKRADLDRCQQLCITEAYCSVYTFSYSSGNTTLCKLYDQKLVTALEKMVGMDTFFLPSNIDVTL
ncbi:uncharacterized protein LOC132728328 [Ruditapes philippinarum]|uniref:uncharacterized protein LOC132728328 n=1 Tax=Ruditapes philippinarum TaxID=129788 RepID=UPI00295B1D3B|nr:uncharacterized protein LOC132728328 [Ruditapes philippinarum]